MSGFIQVILPLKLDWEPYYAVPDGLSVHIGQRVRLELAGKEKVAVVSRLNVRPDVDESRIKSILGPAEGLPDISAAEIRFWRFISDYYLCSVGEVFKAAYPSARTRCEEAAARKALRTNGAEAAAGYSSPSPAASDPKAAERPRVLISPSRTAAYVNEARRMLGNGRSVLVLVPENAAGDALQDKFRDEFKGEFLTYSSRQSAATRRNAAATLRDASGCGVLIGTRSALFLPFRDLGLIIIDEEQDPSHKQNEPNPRYNARDAAVMLARIHGAEVLLGTSCPSAETEFNLLTGKYGYFADRVDTLNAEIIDTSDELRKNGMKGALSIKLLEAIKDAEKTVLIRGWEQLPELEGRIEELLPGKDITVQTVSAAQNDSVKADLVAVLQADAFFRKEDFRSDERVRQMLMRIQSHAGRMIIQTAKSRHPVFCASCPTEKMLEERKDFNLPPFTRLVDIHIRDNNRARLSALSGKISAALPFRKTEMSGDGEVTYRITLERNNAAAAKMSIRRCILSIEKSCNYNGHIVIDVDPA